MGKSRQPEKGKKSNAIGNKENSENRDIALQTLDIITKKREANGYIWIVKGRTSKQIHPDKLEANLLDNWKVSKGKK